MPPIAPRMPARLLDVIERLSRRSERIAEINRRVGAEAERMGLPRPSYQQVRVLVHEARRLRASGPSRVDVVVDVIQRPRRSDELVRQLFDAPPRLRDRASETK